MVSTYTLNTATLYVIVLHYIPLYTIGTLRIFSLPSSLERLVLHCKLRGPSWLNIKLPS